LPVIYVTLGSTGAVESLPKIVRALEGLPATVVVATAGRVALPTVPRNVFAADYLPGLEVCRRAALVVCSGGSATAYQALSQGTPLVGIWGNEDQYLTMMAVEHRGAGLGCRISEASARTLEGLVTEVLSRPHYRQAAQAVAHEFASCDAPQRFTEFVRTFSARIG
jgi:UDP:flavonoid glycosyltransferase YjiC (YdhE family)